MIWIALAIVFLLTAILMTLRNPRSVITTPYPPSDPCPLGAVIPALAFVASVAAIAYAYSQ